MKERKISKKKLIALSGISVYEYRKMRENKDVNLATLRKVCKTFSVDYSEIISICLINHKSNRTNH